MIPFLRAVLFALREVPPTFRSNYWAARGAQNLNE